MAKIRSSRGSRRRTATQENVSILSHSAICVLIGLTGKVDCDASNHNGN